MWTSRAEEKAGMHSLYRNNGNGTFTDVSEAARINQAPATYGMTVVAADLDDDGWQDIQLLSDSTPSLLFMNNRDGTFREEGVLDERRRTERRWHGTSGRGGQHQQLRTIWTDI